MTIAIRPAAPEDVPDVLALLHASALPVEGLEDHLDTLLVAIDGDGLVGCAGLELYDGGALLRSVAVRATHRGTGLGQRLTGAALDLARARGAAAVFLLTETAASFFPRFGFAETTRDRVPADVKTSVEFVSLCPQSATVMMRRT
jgi:amino-acid N-acetyltransferase